MGKMDWFKRWRSKPARIDTPVVSDAKLWISSVKFSDGTAINLEKDAIFVLTGPNNVGKSACLREIRDYLTHGSNLGPVLSSLQIQISGDKDSFVKVILENSLKDDDDKYVKIKRSAYRIDSVALDYEKSFVGSKPMDLFLAYMGASERLELARSTRRGDYLNNAPDEPLQWLEFDENAEEKICELFERAFGARLILNTLAGDSLRFHVGPRDGTNPPVSAKAYSEWISKIPTLDRQGDGIRSFTGTILSLLVHPRNIVLLDEPEVFLHAPQIRRLAEVITKETSSDSQIVMATHSDHMVRSLLDSSGNRVVIARIIRNGNKNNVSILKSEQIIELWTDPILKTSDVLSSLFHDVAVLCEGDSDARFFGALLDATRTEQRDLDARFYSFGGKDRIASVAASLRSIKTPLVAVVDIDILSDKAKFIKLFESLGGDKSKIEIDVKNILIAVNARRGTLTGPELAIELDRISENAKIDIEISKITRDKLTDLSRTSSNWLRIKQDGYIGLVDAKTIQAYERVAAAAQAVGLLIVSEGELEGFCRQISRTHKSEWLNEVLKRDFVNDPQLENARKFGLLLRTAIKAALERQLPSDPM